MKGIVASFRIQASCGLIIIDFYLLNTFSFNFLNALEKKISRMEIKSVKYLYLFFFPNQYSLDLYRNFFLTSLHVCVNVSFSNKYFAHTRTHTYTHTSQIHEKFSMFKDRVVVSATGSIIYFFGQLMSYLNSA